MALPGLPFGEDIAVTQDNAQHFGDLIERVFPGMNAYNPLTDAQSFRSRSAVIAMPTASIVATALSPTHVDRRNNPQLTFLLPYAGDSANTCKVGDKTMQWGQAQQGMFLPQTNERVVGSGGCRSQIMWQLGRERLLSTALAMLGTAEPVNLLLDEARVLPNQIGGVSVLQAFGAVLPLLRLHAQRPALLSQLGLEDLLYRQSVMLLRPDLFGASAPGVQDTSDSVTQARQQLAPVCDYMLAHLGASINLTLLEQVSQRSARSLQMLFSKAYDCSPMAWLKEQRLVQAWHTFLANDQAPIQSVAQSLGFPNLPPFFVAYKSRFGETPGQTRARRKVFAGR